MARPTGKDMLGWVVRGEVLMAVGVIGVIMLLIVPIPSLLLDMLLAISIVASVLILMTALMMKRPLDFAIFPTVLLVATLYRLGLNLATTRLILTHGHEGHDSAGQVIQAFGSLMMGELHGHHQGLDPDRRGLGPLHPGLHARQADGHRRRSVLGSDR